MLVTFLQELEQLSATSLVPSDPAVVKEYEALCGHKLPASLAALYEAVGGEGVVLFGSGVRRFIPEGGIDLVSPSSLLTPQRLFDREGQVSDLFGNAPFFLVGGWNTGAPMSIFLVGESDDPPVVGVSGYGAACFAGSRSLISARFTKFLDWMLEPEVLVANRDEQAPLVTVNFGRGITENDFKPIAVRAAEVLSGLCDLTFDSPAVGVSNVVGPDDGWLRNVLRDDTREVQIKPGLQSSVVSLVNICLVMSAAELLDGEVLDQSGLLTGQAFEQLLTPIEALHSLGRLRVAGDIDDLFMNFRDVAWVPTIERLYG